MRWDERMVATGVKGDGTRTGWRAQLGQLVLLVLLLLQAREGRRTEVLHGRKQRFQLVAIAAVTVVEPPALVATATAAAATAVVATGPVRRRFFAPPHVAARAFLPLLVRRSASDRVGHVNSRTYDDLHHDDS